MGENILVGFIFVVIFGIPVVGAYIWYKKWRGGATEDLEVDFLTNDWRIVTKRLPIETNLQIALWHKRKQAVFEDGAAVYENEKGKMCMLATLDSAVPVYPTEDDDYRQEKAKLYKSIESQLALRACDRDENNIQKEDKSDKFQETVQILALGAGILIVIMILVWLATSGVSFNCASPY